jgi:allophanate hydrolase subunit 2
MQVVSSGLEMTIQDLPGRTIGKGIPCSGPMDPISFSIGNFIVANEKETEGIEIIVIPGVPACFRFLCRSEIAITGREVTVLVNEVEHNVWSRLIIPPGGVVRIMAKQGGEGGGLRTYLLVRGGFPGVPLYLGSKSTSVSIGGYQVCQG